MVKKAQIWVDQEYPQTERHKKKYLNISNENLEGDLNLSGFTNLEELICHNNKLTSLVLNDCTNLRKLDCYSNKIVDVSLEECSKLESVNFNHNNLEIIDLSNCPNLISLHSSDNKFRNTSFLKKLPNPAKLEELVLWNNTELTGNLEFLVRFVGLEVLSIQNCSLSGSLEFLQNSKLKEINISNTDIDSGLEFLPESCEKVYCNCDYQGEKKAIKIAKELGNFLESDLVENTKYYNLTKWREQKCDNISLVIPLERLFVIRSNFKRFVDKWGIRRDSNEKEKKDRPKNFITLTYVKISKLWKKEGDDLSELSRLNHPNDFGKQRWLITGIQWVNRAASVVGGSLLLVGTSNTENPNSTQYTQAGGVIAIIAPFIETVTSYLNDQIYEAKQKKWDEFVEDAKNLLDNYHELLGILKTIKFNEKGKINKVLNELRGEVEGGKIDRESKVGVFLKNYDEDENGVISVSELIRKKEILAKDLSSEQKEGIGSQLGNIVLAVKDLEEKIIKYRQGTLYEAGEEEVQVVVTTDQQDEQQSYSEILPKSNWNCWIS